jgi:hypothetical protein
MIEITLYSQDGQTEILLGRVATRREANRLVASLDQRYAQWKRVGRPALGEGDVLQHYENCDIFADYDDGRMFTIVNPNEKWEESYVELG